MELAARGWFFSYRGDLLIGRSFLEVPLDFFAEQVGLCIYGVRDGV